MSVLRIVRSIRIRCSQYNIHFISKYATFSQKKKSRLKNKFASENDFKNQRSCEEESNIVSADLMSVENKSRGIKLKPERKLSPLSYNGEILYGIHPVYLALLEKRRHFFQLFLKTYKGIASDSGRNVRLKEIEKLARTLGIPVRNLDSKDMERLAPHAVHQGICLDASPLPMQEWQQEEDFIVESEGSSDLPLWIVLHEILDPMNVGAIIRSAQYFGVDRLFVVKGNSCKLSPTVSKASSGALEVMKIYQVEKLETFLQVKKTQGWNILSTVVYCEDQSETSKLVKNIKDLDVSKPTIIILGNEGKGISSEIQKFCDGFVSISPSQKLQPGIDSLNVSVAAGVILYSLSTKMKCHH